MSKELIIFDMDGTLVDSSVTISNAINHVRSNLSLPQMDHDRIIAKINDQTIAPARYFYEADRFEPYHEAWFSQYYTLHHAKELMLYEGISGLLEDLKTNGFKLAVATNAYRRSTIESLKHLDIYDLFDAVACADDVSRGKPSPDMLFKILDELEIVANDALFVGDGSRDQMASQKASIEYLMVNWGFSEYEDALHNIDALKQVLLPRQ